MKLSRFLPLALLSAAASAQTSPELIGLVNGANSPVVRQDPSTCQTRACPTQLAPATIRSAGGTAYDATRGAVWVSNGALLQAVDPVACRVLCPPRPLPGVAASRITGLAINEDQGVLVVTNTANVISQYELACPIATLKSRCDATSSLPLGHTIGGIATDDVRDLVIYSSSDFSGATNPGNTLYVARRGDPCARLCRVSVPSCGPARLGPITGVAFDSCDLVVWVTDGQRSVGLRLNGLSPCSVQEIQCCTLPINARYSGLCIMPSRATSAGQSCTNLGCPTCPGMAHTTTGDPVLGNASFSLDLVGAPRGSRGALWIAGGACNPPGILIRPFCGPILVQLVPPPIIINIGTGPGLGCGGGFKVPIPIPLDRSLCGGTLSSQAFGICVNGSPGTFVSNCLTWTVTGS